MEANETMDNVNIEAEVVEDTVAEVARDNRALVIGGAAAGAAVLIALAYKFGKPAVEKLITNMRGRKAANGTAADVDVEETEK